MTLLETSLCGSLQSGTMSAAARALFLLLMVYGLGDCMDTPCLDLNVLHSNDPEVNLTFPARFNMSNIIVLVTSVDPENLICRFRHDKDECIGPWEVCVCHKDSNTFTVKGTVDSGGWKITARKNGHSLNFCRKAPQITSFSISIENAPAATNGSTVPTTLSLDNMTTVVVDVNSTLNISCSWTGAIPVRNVEHISQSPPLPASQRLLGHSDPGGQHHDYKTHVQCQDSGPLECPGSGVNVTGTLLVRCSPEFPEAGSGMLVKTVSTSRSSSIAFRLTTYDTDIMQCRLTPLPSDDTALGHTMECPGFSVTGIVPNLTLTLTSVTSQMEGRWRLKIENRIGSSEVEFQLRIVTGEHADKMDQTSSSEGTAPSPESEEKPRARGGVHLILTASLCALCVLFLLVVIVLLFRLKTSLTEMKQRQLARLRIRHRPRQRDQAAVWERDTNSVNLMIHNNLYEASQVKDAFGYSEVRDSCFRPIPDLPCDVTQSRHSHSPPPLPAVVSRVKLLQVKDGDLYKGSKVTGRVDHSGYTQVRSIGKRLAVSAAVSAASVSDAPVPAAAAAAMVTDGDSDSDSVMAATGGCSLSLERGEEEKEEEGVYTEIKYINERFPSDNADDGDNPKVYVSPRTVRKWKVEQEKHREKSRSTDELYVNLTRGQRRKHDEKKRGNASSTDELYVNLTRGQRRKHDEKKRGNAKPIHQMPELFSPNTTKSPSQEPGDYQTGEDPALLSKE